MGNTGFRKLLFAGDYCETHYQSLHQIQVIDLQRQNHSLSQYKDKIVLVVNVGQSSQSQVQLQKLNQIKDKYSGQLEILGFPCDQFRHQVNGIEGVKTFYQKQHHVNFPVFAKVDVNGPYTDYLYRYLKKHSELFDDNLLTCRIIQSDYSKFLVDKQGKVRRFYTLNNDFETIEADIQKLL